MHKRKLTTKSWLSNNKSKATHMGLRCYTTPRQRQNHSPTTSNNWQSALILFQQFLGSYTPQSNLLITKGYSHNNTNCNSIDIINKLCQRSITQKTPSDTLNYVDDFKFTTTGLCFSYCTPMVIAYQLLIVIVIMFRIWSKFFCRVGYSTKY